MHPIVRSVLYPHGTWARRLVAALFSICAVAVVTGAIFALRPFAPVLSLGVLYLFAVLPVAAIWGLPFALGVSAVSMLTFNWFFLQPTHTFRLQDSENWVALAVYLLTAVSVSELAARARRRAAEAEQLARDVQETEARRRTEAVAAEALRRSDAAKTAVLRSVSHDLRSPITAILTATEMLDDATALTPAARDELLESISMEAHRLERLVSNLLDLSRLEAGAANPMPELWPIDGLVARALQAIGAANERVSVELDRAPLLVSVDPAQIEHVLVNLIDNALKFSPPDERVRVRAERNGEDVVLRVSDTGPGIPERDSERIFEPFTRSANGNARGSGLGLAIARGFAQVNGGRVSVEPSTRHGAVFVLVLPAVTAPARVLA